eukprot:1606388-Pyramimonas_sp.AAC.1
MHWLSQRTQELHSLLRSGKYSEFLDHLRRLVRSTWSATRTGGTLKCHFLGGLELWTGLLREAVSPLRAPGAVGFLEARAWSLLAFHHLASFMASIYLPREKREIAERWRDWCSEALSGGAKWAHASTKVASDKRQAMFPTDDGMHES